MYLKRDITGQASGFHYGQKGDKVIILESETNWKSDMLLVENKGVKFWIFPDDLSENKIEDERQKIVERIQPIHKVKRRR